LGIRPSRVTGKVSRVLTSIPASPLFAALGPVSVLLADDHGVLRDSVKLLLEKDGDIRVVASVADGVEAVRQAVRLAPRVAVLDISMPGTGGIEAARILARAAPAVAVLMLSVHAAPEIVRQALRAGASGYVLKSAAGEELLRAVRALGAGRRYVAAGLAETGPELLGGGRALAQPLDTLTAREREVLRLVAEGKSNAEAARALGLSTRTVETYRARLMQKLRLDSIAALVKFAIRHGLVSAD
jgi:DNA-binding NarL/FixJ family response regulator